MLEIMSRKHLGHVKLSSNIGPSLVKPCFWWLVQWWDSIIWYNWKCFMWLNIPCGAGVEHSNWWSTSLPRKHQCKHPEVSGCFLKAPNRSVCYHRKCPLCPLQGYGCMPFIFLSFKHQSISLWQLQCIYNILFKIYLLSLCNFLPSFQDCQF